jgi:hypothetical protein
MTVLAVIKAVLGSALFLFSVPVLICSIIFNETALGVLFFLIRNLIIIY